MAGRIANSNDSQGAGRALRWLFASSVIVLALAIAISNFRPRPSTVTAAPIRHVVAQQRRAPQRPAPRVGEYIGVARCATSGCHGGPLDRAEYWEKSYTLWLDEGHPEHAADPHQHAYRSLRLRDPELLGYQIVARLQPDAVESDAAYRQFLANRCDACHISPKPTTSNAPPVRTGVSCESCHGPASGWVAEHTTEGWENLSDEQKRRRQFRPLTNLGDRAQTCVGCHVGRPFDTEMEVDHDLIAAGHPRLNFDLRAYHENLPHHWDREKDESQSRSSGDPFQLEIWYEGRYAELMQSLELLAARADRAQKAGVATNWPEFAEYSCYACHHGLGRGEFRQRLVRSGHAPGQMDWSAWHSVYFEFLPKNVQTPLDALTQQLNQPAPDPQAVLQLCATAQQQLGNINKKVDQRALRAVLAEDAYSDLDWDRAKRWWSAWIAATGLPSDSPLRQSIEQEFFYIQSGATPMMDREYSGILDVQSPAHFDSAEFQSLRQQVIDASATD